MIAVGCDESLRRPTIRVRVQALTLPLDTAKVRLQVQTEGNKYKCVVDIVDCLA